MQIKENIKAPRHWPLCGEFTGTGEFPAQRASYAEYVSIWWRHHGITRVLSDKLLISVSDGVIICADNFKSLVSICNTSLSLSVPSAIMSIYMNWILPTFIITYNHFLSRIIADRWHIWLQPPHSCQFCRDHVCVSGGCTTTFRHLLHNLSTRGMGFLFPLLMCNIWCAQIFGYIMAGKSHSFVCILIYLVFFIMQAYMYQKA